MADHLPDRNSVVRPRRRSRATTVRLSFPASLPGAGCAPFVRRRGCDPGHGVSACACAHRAEPAVSRLERVAQPTDLPQRRVGGTADPGATAAVRKARPPVYLHPGAGDPLDAPGWNNSHSGGKRRNGVAIAPPEAGPCCPERGLCSAQLRGACLTGARRCLNVLGRFSQRRCARSARVVCVSALAVGDANVTLGLQGINLGSLGAPHKPLDIASIGQVSGAKVPPNRVPGGRRRVP